MASIFPPVIEYTQDFVPNDTKMPQLERTISGQTIKSYIPQFSGDSIEMLLYMVSKFLNAMQTQTINANLWQDQFGYTVHGDPSDLWDAVLQDGDNNDDPFDRDEVSRIQSINHILCTEICCRSKRKRHPVPSF